MGKKQNTVPAISTVVELPLTALERFTVLRMLDQVPVRNIEDARLGLDLFEKCADDGWALRKEVKVEDEDTDAAVQVSRSEAKTLSGVIRSALNGGGVPGKLARSLLSVLDKCGAVE